MGETFFASLWRAHEKQNRTRAMSRGFDHAMCLTGALYIHISRIMDINSASLAFSALSQNTRLKAFRLLIEAGGDGITAGDIAAKMGAKQNTMSANLSILQRAGLIRSAREGRSIRYFADFEGTRRLLQFLMQDCCGGDPSACRPLLDEIIQAS